VTVTKTIETARSYLPTNRGAYARTMAAAIRSASSDKAARAYRVAIVEDSLEFLFVNLWSDCPIVGSEHHGG
jgi:hypothetical protein